MKVFMTTLLIFASTQVFAAERMIKCIVRVDQGVAIDAAEKIVFSDSFKPSELNAGGIILGTYNGLEIAVTKDPSSYLLNLSMTGPNPEDLYVMQGVLEHTGSAVMFLSIPNNGKRTAVGCGFER